MYLLSLYGCVFNLVFTLLFNRFLKHKLVLLTLICSLVISFSCSLIVFYEVMILKTPCFLYLTPWIQSGFLNLQWTFVFDSLSVTLLCIVLFISLLVHLYSLDYMHGDPHILRFVFSLSLFTFFMLLMVTSNNVLQLFFGWEGVGLSSYLLINFWFSRLEANKSAIKAIVVNRIGDFGLYVALLFLVFTFKTLNLGAIFSMCSVFAHSTINVIGFDFSLLSIIASFIFLGTMGKSAQIGLHMWLPDAMEGPTPVSALLHAATMVTAGVFVLMRFSIVVAYVPSLLFFVFTVGTLTTFFAGISALFQYDIKKIIAYSTCSHLGIMLILCGFSHYDVAIFHLFNHAFFKALLFLSAGAMLHSLGDEQDIRKMGGVVFIMPFTYATFLIGSLSLIGFPFLSGFFSKDRAWELMFSHFYDYCSNSLFLEFSLTGFAFYKYSFFFFTLIVVLSVAYSLRLLVFVFPFTYNGFKSNLFSAREPSIFMWAPLFLLAFLSIFAGYVFKDLFVGLGVGTWFTTFPKVFFHTDFGLVVFQESFFSFVLNWNQLFLKWFTFLLTVGFACVFIRYFYPMFLYRISYQFAVSFAFLFRFIFLCFLSCLPFPFLRSMKSSFFFIFVFFASLSFLFFSFYSLIPLLSLFVPFFKTVTNTSFRSFNSYNKLFYRTFFSYLAADHFLYKWVATLFSYVAYHVTFKSIDRGFIEHFGPFGITSILQRLSTGVGSVFFRPSFFSFLFVIFFVSFSIFVSVFWFNCFCFIKGLLFVFTAYFLLVK